MFRELTRSSRLQPTQLGERGGQIASRSAPFLSAEGPPVTGDIVRGLTAESRPDRVAMPTGGRGGRVGRVGRVQKVVGKCEFLIDEQLFLHELFECQQSRPLLTIFVESYGHILWFV